MLKIVRYSNQNGFIIRDDLHMFREKKDKTILHKISSFVAVNEKSSKIYLLLFTSQIL